MTELTQRIQISALEGELSSIKKDYSKSIERFEDIMRRADMYQDQFPDGFVDVLTGTVVLERAVCDRHL
jgi:hypothetical protein